ncbi:TatD family hydrolase [bacterium]|nr:TatD family hydrolase [bacterium]
MVDTHCHLAHPEFKGREKEIVQKALDAGLYWLIIVGYDLKSSQDSLAINHYRFPIAVGIHPHDTANITNPDLELLKALANAEDVCAIGETGLDFYRFLSPRDKQIESFLFHLSLAQKKNLPVIVHSRGAEREVLSILQDFPNLKVVLHCFEGSKAELIEAIDRGYYIGVAGNVTYPRSIIRENLKYLPVDRMLLETDSPYLPPQPFRGKTNEPAYLPLIAEKVASFLNLPIEYIIETTSYNAENLFKRCL